MIYITGDTHGDILRFRTEEIDRLTADDVLIVCGDFGMLFYPKSDRTGQNADKMKLDELAQKPFDLLFIDGNHENFDEIYSYPETEKYGNTVHKIRDNIFHLERGRIYNIQQQTFFTFGGAYSMDKYRRQEGYSWWCEELPCDEEYKRGAAALKEVGFKVDYIITHTAPQQIIRQLGYTPVSKDAELTGYLEWIMYETDFKKWFFGHFHEDRDMPLSEKCNFRALFCDMAVINDGEG